MEAASIDHLLKSFCDNSQWHYAVFWKLNHHFPMTLTWENGYQKRNETVGSMWGDINFKSLDDVYSLRGEGTDDSRDYSAGVLMNEMSHCKYNLGEGVVGKVAPAKDHFWVSCEDIFTSKFDGNLIPECLDEWLLQFAFGIKTIVLVPVLPHGVLQFGSFEAVSEDLEFVTNIKKKFHPFPCLEATTTLLDLKATTTLLDLIENIDWTSSALTYNMMDSLDESSSITNGILSTFNINESTRLNPTRLSSIQDNYSVYRENRPKRLKRANEKEIVSSSVDPRHIGLVETKSNPMEEELWAWSHLVGNEGEFGETSNGLCSSSGNHLTEEQFGGTEIGHSDAKNLNEFSTFTSVSELHKALGSVAYRQKGKSVLKYISDEDTYCSSTLISNKKEHGQINGLGFPEEIDPEYLLDAVVGNLCSASDETSNGVKSLITKPREFTGSIQPKINSGESTLNVKNSEVGSDLIPGAVVLKGKDEYSNHFISSLDGISSSLIDEAQRENVNNNRQPMTGSKSKLSNMSKKTQRVGNNKKARPKDRQMIMDRMKELRELVPDGGRCSIDNLLERTIKHMIYLRKITSQAEKLKRFADREVPKLKKQKITGSHSGRTRAFDVENEPAWPIVVEDLEGSGNMLIEMICNEHGLFLEIAQVIRRLDITILKGVLENRSSASWACFVVEVPRGFHRMDVLCPLLHLLQFRRNCV